MAASSRSEWTAEVHTAQDFDARVRAISRVHTAMPRSIDWTKVRAQPAPPKPEYRPGMVDRMLGHKAETDPKYQGELRRHEDAIAKWQVSVARAEQVLARDPDAYVSGILPERSDQLGVMGVEARYRATPDAIEAQLLVHGPAIVPDHVLTILKSGKTSVKPMPPARAASLYQDYVCGSVLAMGRLVFAALPVDRALVNAFAPVLDTSTGHHRPLVIVSVWLDRAAFTALNFDLLDPCDALTRFGARMGFTKSGAVAAVEPLAWVAVPGAATAKAAAGAPPAARAKRGEPSTQGTEPSAGVGGPGKYPVGRAAVPAPRREEVDAHSLPERTWSPPRGIPMDPGLDFVAYTHKMLQIDPEWCVTEDRGFT